MRSLPTLMMPGRHFTCYSIGLLPLGWLIVLLVGPSAAAIAESPVVYSHRFPDFKMDYKPPDNQYDGPLFRLSQDYPEKLPELDEGVKSILAIPFDQNGFRENWKTYLLAVRDYCFAGNLEVDWRGQENPIRKWYHVPWQHFGEKGREGIHGLTREASAKARQLAPTQLSKFESHAVALYNPQGGYTIGQVWQNQFEPEPQAARFPEGTVVAKVLFTQADDNEVPYLQNPVEWEAYVNSPRDPKRREVQKLRLLQMDVMVRDSRANDTGGWVFGTFCYNGALQRKNPWENLVPVGLQWGNDDQLATATDNPVNPEPVATNINVKLQQTVVNKSSELPPQHLGWGGRLNGPADYYRSSCMSCHSTAQYPIVAPQHPDFHPEFGYVPGSKAWMAWFRNPRIGASFSPHVASKSRAVSTDFSLQLQIGIDNFYDWKESIMGGYFTPVLPGDKTGVRIETFEPTSEPPSHGT